MRTTEIRALSGLRIVAAVWVVLFHFRPLLEQAAPGFRSALAPVLDCGAQGVDLFFILSGFVLTYNYLDRMGNTWSWRSTLQFLWLRLARVWPVYLVTMHLAALWMIFTLNIGHVPSPAADQLTAMNYIKQFLLVQLWFQPFFDGSSWDGPAWSISAEWLAYLMFGGLVLIVFRIARATRARGLILLAVASAMPPILLLMATGQFYTPWSWLPRIVMQFTAGALLCAAVCKMQPSDRARRGAGYAAVLLAAAIVGILYLLDAYPMTKIYDSSGFVDVLFVPLVFTLAIGAGTLPGLLSIRPMVYLGHISFSLYMVHELVHTTWNWMVEQFELRLLADLNGKLTLLTIIGVAFAGAALLYHFVEEPARRWMRSMMKSSREARTEPVPGNLAPIHTPREERAKTVSVRAV
ncbi:acyltransferase family protein [Mycolicibacterium holsaticum]|uniref:acyltransferase family protein n=1 Tax=Mycolicibacterium holsaticum TaxID=152142 RepID=UPI001C7DC8EC|nr:acyltransferase [Mycolicibacterium holsaticum]MDA4107769.1 acyltransferase [Mycolicibacterium holsaticum DSM 44478 = JCM 12374]QZA14782.1 acyltransferase [Mycolicibacterium holsaticum DSM 44478 = JCM 12374]UNC07776.1 acyltransferase [Mycolicibacterium holsaticum DSM 44478 = JCM 12374]